MNKLAFKFSITFNNDSYTILGKIHQAATLVDGLKKQSSYYHSHTQLKCKLKLKKTGVDFFVSLFGTAKWYE